MLKGDDARVNFARRGLRFVWIFVAMILLFVVSLTAVVALPQHRIITNLKPSAALLKKEGVYPRLALGNNTYRLDNFDDASWLDIAIVTEPVGPLVNAMAMFRGPVYNNDTIAMLAHDVSAPRESPPGTNAYYWHGYQLFLRPALMLFNYGEIRYLNLMLMGLLACAVALVAARRVDSLLAGVFLFSLLMCGFWSVPLTINYSSDAYLMLLGSLVVLLWVGRPSFRTYAAELFFILGMLTAFFDNLTNPFITLGVPLAFALIALARSVPSDPARRDVALAGGAMAAWGVGYVGSWLSKWLIASAVLKWDVVKRGAEQFMFRAGATDAQPHQLDAIRLNILGVFPLVRSHRPGGLLLLAAILALVVALLIWYRRPAETSRRLLPLLMVAPLPFVYYIVASNHTTIHNWITYRSLVVTVLVLVYFTLAAIDFERLGRRLGLSREIVRPDGAIAGGG